MLVEWLVDPLVVGQAMMLVVKLKVMVIDKMGYKLEEKLVPGIASVMV